MQRRHSRFLSCRLGVKSDLLHRNHDWSDLNGSLAEMYLQQNDVNDSNVWRSQAVAYLSFIDAEYTEYASCRLNHSRDNVLHIPANEYNTFSISVKLLTPDNLIIVRYGRVDLAVPGTSPRST